MDIQTILDIRAQRNNVKNSLQRLRGIQDSDEKYGSEHEYTIREIVTEIDSILIDILALTRAPRQFVQKSAYMERVQLLQSLESLYEGIEREDFDKLVAAIDEITPVLRSLNVHYTDERLEAFDEHVNEIQQTSSNLSQHIATVEDHVDTSRNHMETIEDFSRRISERESQLEDQRAATSLYKEKLEAFEAEHEQHLSDAEELIEKARQALEYTTAEGLSAAFTEQYSKADDIA